eukprot:1136860-Pelagomonas_calceolata.AAC.5
MILTCVKCRTSLPQARIPSRQTYVPSIATDRTANRAPKRQTRREAILRFTNGWGQDVNRQEKEPQEQEVH